MEDHNLAGQNPDLQPENENAEWIVDGCDVVTMKLVRTIEGEPQSFKPEYVYQHFGQEESIFGYKDLAVTLSYNACDLQTHFAMSSSEQIKDQELKPDDVYKSVWEFWPDGQTDTIFKSRADFDKTIAESPKFEPYGELVHTYTVDERTFTIHRVRTAADSTTDDARAFLARAQSLAFWFIESATYCDLDEPQWTFYTIHERCSVDGTTLHPFVGYATVYEFYGYPEHKKPRVAQILVLPPFRQLGHGVRLLQQIYNEAVHDKNVLKVTVEDPSESCSRMRDYVDVCNCATLASFNKENLVDKPFDKAMENEALKRLKISPLQSHRVYEILRLKYTPRSDAKQWNVYKKYVSDRLKKQFVKSKREIAKLSVALSKEEFMLFTLTQLKGDELEEKVTELFDELITEYGAVLGRVEKYGHQFTDGSISAAVNGM